MKFEINQVVYFFTVRAGQLSIESMVIHKIEASKSKMSPHCICYSGELLDDCDSMPHSEWEERLFTSRDDAIAEIERQLAVIKG